MSTVLVWREQFQKLYAKYSFYIIRILQFALGLAVFGMINSNIGFLKTASTLICTIGLAVICAFLPLGVMTLVATMLILAHMYVLSVGVMLIVGMLFLLIYIFYLRFVPDKAWVILLSAVAVVCKVPFVIIIGIGLLGTPVFLVSTVCGTFSYYILHTVKVNSTSLKGEKASEWIAMMMKFYKQLFTNKEMLLMVAIVIVCGLLVYGLRTRSMNHAWKIATVAGVLTAVAFSVIGNVVFNIHIAYPSILIDGILAIIIGLLFEVLFLSVDYSRTEYLEFEDDEYHYYVKAVPKVAVTAPEKNVKQITGQTNDEKNDGMKSIEQNDKPETANNYGRNERAEDLLLTRSLNKELGIDDTAKK